MGSSILHISDIHPRPGDNLSRLAEGMLDVLKPFRVDFLVASGDLGYQGQNHQTATQWMRQLAEMINVPKERRICVPGNHDVDKSHLDAAFGCYSRSLLELFENSDRTVVRSAQLYVCDDHEFLLVNSAFHLDTAYGMVDCDAIRGVLRDRQQVSKRVVVVHHNPISVAKSDSSTIVNAYEFLRVVSDADYDVVLHGHQHIAMSLRVGKKTRLAGVGSVNFKPWLNTNNQFNIVEIDSRVVRFRFHADSTSGSRMGNWDAHPEPW